MPSLRAQMNNIAAMAKSGFADDLCESAAVLPDDIIVTFVSLLLATQAILANS